MELAEAIDKAFAGRDMPARLTDSDFDPLDSDLADVLSFSGRNWREITWNDWKRHNIALCFLLEMHLHICFRACCFLLCNGPGTHWNGRWRRFMREKPLASPQEIISFKNQLEVDFEELLNCILGLS
jgi:hypothetical protein